MVANGQWSDLIVDFMTYTESDMTPNIYRKWSAISLVGGAMERRVWAKTGNYYTYPNLYVLLVAPPGTGKYIIENVKEFWKETKEPSGGKAFKVASDSMTRASLIDEMARAKSIRILAEGPPLIYHSLLVAAEEFEVLLPAYDPPFISVLNAIWNNKEEHTETRRHGPAKEVAITKPQLNILGGVQPSYFTAHFPEEAWSTGLIRRIIMIYASEAPLKDMFVTTPNRDELRQSILYRLAMISALYGEAKWTAKAAERINIWHMKGGPPVPQHSRLVGYATSRTMMTTKLALISAIARTCQPVIDEIDVTRAMEWLFEAESLMPDIFRAMQGRSDSQVIEELHYFVQGMWVRKNREPVSTASIVYFLQQRVPADRIAKIIEVAERADMIARRAGTEDQWIPRPKHQHGVE